MTKLEESQKKVKGTRKQKKAIAILAENVGMPVGTAMLKAGYKKNTALTPQRLTESVAYKSLAERIPDDLMEKVQLEGMAATVVRFTPEGERIDVADYGTRHKYLDTAHKLKGTYAPEKSVTLHQVSIENRTYIEQVAQKAIEELKNDKS